MSDTPTTKPHIAILGAGPIGLEAALAAAEHGFPFTLYERSPDSVAGNVASWAHVRLFTGWSLNASPRARRVLAAAGHAVPEGEACPTGGELVEKLLAPIGALPQVAPNLRLGHTVRALGRTGLLKHEEIGSAERAGRRFRLLIEAKDGARTVELVAEADVILDCTGSYEVPNYLGDGGIPAPGEGEMASEIVRRIPDVTDEDGSWAGKTVLLVGAGHSAQTAARDLAALAEEHPGTRVVWALRSDEPSWGDPGSDSLPERAALVRSAAGLASGAHPAVETRTGVVVDQIARNGSGLSVTLRSRNGGGRETVAVDRVLALTGAVGDHQLYRQLQVHECYATSGPMKLAAALLGSAGGDCLDQQSHGADTLENPEPGFFILGSKSYGRNNSFLLRVGWEQVDEVFSLI